MKKLRCDKPYDIDEARKRKGLSRRKRKDSRTTAYELTIRVPEEYRTYFDGKKKLTRTVFALTSYPRSNEDDVLNVDMRFCSEQQSCVLQRGPLERSLCKTSRLDQFIKPLPSDKELAADLHRRNLALLDQRIKLTPGNVDVFACLLDVEPDRQRSARRDLLVRAILITVTVCHS